MGIADKCVEFSYMLRVVTGVPVAERERMVNQVDKFGFVSGGRQAFVRSSGENPRSTGGPKATTDDEIHVFVSSS